MFSTAESSPPNQLSANVGPGNSTHSNCVNTLVYGSSLTRDLKCDLLSKRGKTFKVFTKGGARVETVIRMIRDSLTNNEVCTSCVEAIFLVVGGNDAENIRSASGLEKLKHSFNDLIGLINSKFPTVRINIVSLIPRRCNGYMHLQRILCINEFLLNLCKNVVANCYYIQMFTKYILYKGLYRSRQEVYLNERLFKGDRIHFTPVGVSVLAKTLIAVANNPH